MYLDVSEHAALDSIFIATTHPMEYNFSNTKRYAFDVTIPDLPRYTVERVLPEIGEVSLVVEHK